MGFLDAFERLVGRGKQQQQMQRPQQAAPQAPAPDITYNPSPNANVPFSARTPEMAQMGNRYTANPTSPEFIGVDPQQFGYPEDMTARPQIPVMQNRQNLQSFNDPEWSVRLPQGPAFNPGANQLQQGSYTRRVQPGSWR